MENELKTVAIIGRPNVGKSTLFNRLVGRRMAIETPVAGTTRDRLFGEVFWQGTKFNLMDVAGIESGSKREIDKSIQEGATLAMSRADLILFTVDWNEPENEADRKIARELRKSDKPIILVVNKADNIKRQQELDPFKRLGNFPIVPISAISGSSTGDLLEEICKKLQKVSAPATKIKREKYDISLAIIGRPNVGKSTLLNTIIGEKRAVVSEEAGTTRDVVSVSFSHKGKKVLIADTAGIRRPGKIEKDTIESFSLLRAYQALRNCDVAILMIDGTEGLVALDVNILGKAKEWGKGIIIAVNKIDQIKEDDFQDRLLSILRGKLNFAPWLPVVFISALNEVNINHLLTQVIKVDENRSTNIPPEKLEEILILAKESNQQLLNLKAIKQKKNNPPIFEVVYSGKEAPHYSQIRYLENKIRDFFPMNGTPIFIDLYSLRKKKS